MIQEDFVSFETAKLLKEKGFDETCRSFWKVWDKHTTLCDCSPSHMFEYCHNSMLEKYNDEEELNIAAPTLQMAMKWLREEKGVAVIPVLSSVLDNEKFLWDIKIVVAETNDTYSQGWVYEKQEEACEAAIKYCLKNLIKNEDEEEESAIPAPKTVDEAISTLERILSDEDREYLLENGAISMHDSLGRWIRNEWGLWTGSELKDELMNMNKGLNHPDDMSNYIIEEFIKYWNNKL